MDSENSQSVRTETDPIVKVVAAGHAALLITGNVHDFTLKGARIAYQPQLIADELYDRGYIVIRYSKSQGGRVHNNPSLTPKEKGEIDSRLDAVGLSKMLNRDSKNDPEEIRNFFRATSRLLQLPASVAKPVAVILDYAEHLAPAVQTSAAASDFKGRYGGRNNKPWRPTIYVAARNEP